MTPDGALTATIARLTAAGLKEARSPLGVRNESSPRLDRSFSIRIGTLAPASAPSRGKADVVGLRVTQRLTVELCHQLKPNSGQAAPGQALSDLHAAMRYLSVGGTTLSTGAAIDIGSASAEYVGGGAYMIHAFSLGLTYNLTLVV